MSQAPSLFARHRAIALGIAKDYYLPGGDRDDVRQEALIALWIACRDHDPKKGPFPSFARMVVRRRLDSCVKQARRPKQLVLTDAARDDWDGPTLPDACTVAIDRERLRSVAAAVCTLTQLERQSLRRLLNGEPQRDKQDENTRWRLRRKLRAAV